MVKGLEVIYSLGIQELLPSTVNGSAFCPDNACVIVDRYASQRGHLDVLLKLVCSEVVAQVFKHLSLELSKLFRVVADFFVSKIASHLRDDELTCILFCPSDNLQSPSL